MVFRFVCGGESGKRRSEQALFETVVQSWLLSSSSSKETRFRTKFIFVCVEDPSRFGEMIRSGVAELSERDSDVPEFCTCMDAACTKTSMWVFHELKPMCQFMDTMLLHYGNTSTDKSKSILQSAIVLQESQNWPWGRLVLNEFERQQIKSNIMPRFAYAEPDLPTDSGREDLFAAISSEMACATQDEEEAGGKETLVLDIDQLTKVVHSVSETLCNAKRRRYLLEEREKIIRAERKLGRKKRIYLGHGIIDDLELGYTRHYTEEEVEQRRKTEKRRRRESKIF